VTVDCLDQTPYRPGKPKGPTSTATLLWRQTSDGLDAICGRVQSPRYDAVHTRTLALVDDDFWVVHDRLRAPTAHDYVAHWHLDPAAEGCTGVTARDGQTVVSRPGATIVVPAGFGAVELAPGWVSPEYGVKLPAPVVRVRAEARRDADLLTVLSPGDHAPDVSVAAKDDRLLVDVRRETREAIRLELAPTGVSRS
jgi:hypothetical protein